MYQYTEMQRYNEQRYLDTNILGSIDTHKKYIFLGTQIYNIHWYRDLEVHRNGYTKTQRYKNIDI